ncbi:type VII secretion protein EsaA [Bacillus sp. CECT 9360]|uniref:type VII secretion protein EsaA n=1 Tax=Bacillus sp. CECT 9360 TaxID=2845821 RepID=UPI001E4CAD11|nr:type VII secretion protein EsaA [Bacillus sp. CECT 9360]CAH0347672.1 hypothetical protein BCI9360_04093 [Bacillus sp. CECT 9360]
MSEKIKPLSIIGKMVFILLLPILFFTFVGHDPMKQQETATRGIAIVNEDQGSEYEKGPITFGKEVSSSLDTDSDYKWYVVNRNTAEKGLEDKQYDAVVYLPSDFSRNIMTFNENEPIKAGVQYKVQTSLNAENLEKVQRELEVAKSKMNKQVSTLYWSHVSQAVEDIRKKFDNILEKEIVFQKTMYDFYTPSSKQLAGDISQQKEMLESIFSSTKDAGKTSTETAGEFEASKAKVDTFVEDVTRYRVYQETQSEMFQQYLQESVSNIDDLQTIYSNRGNPRPEFDLDGEIYRLETRITDSNTSLNELSDHIKTANIGEQFDEVLGSQKDLMKVFKERSDIALLDDIQQRLIESRRSLQNGSGEQSGGQTMALNIKESPAAKTNEVTLSGIHEQVSLLRKNLESMKTEQQTGNWAEVNKNLGNLEANVKKVEGQVSQQAATQKQLVIDYKELLKKLQEKLQNMNPANSEEEIIREIMISERNILESSELSERRKNILAGQFNADIQNRNIGQLILYHGLLSSYQQAIQQSTDPEDKLINGIVENQDRLGEIKEDFSATLDTTLKGLESNSSMISGVEEDFGNFAGFVKEYDQNINDEQTEMMTELQLIKENASEISTNLGGNTPVPENEPLTSDNLNGEFFVTMQDSTAGNLKSVSDLVNSVADRQDQVTDYTNELQTKVGTVQKRADDLNNNWALNVESTKLIKNDFYGVLNNTQVDDQQNGYVYDYLANPVQISGDVLKEESSYTPPIIMLVIILISGLLIGFFLHLYSKVAPMVHASLYALLNFIVGLIISIYGLRIYPLEDMQAISWTIFTMLMLFLCSAIVRLAFYIGPFVGSILVIGLIIFFTTPLLDLIMPNFNIDHPVSTVYQSIQFGDSSSFILASIILAIATSVTAAIPYLRNRALIKREMAHEG